MLKCLPGTIAPHGDVHIGTLSSGLGGREFSRRRSYAVTCSVAGPVTGILQFGSRPFVSRSRRLSHTKCPSSGLPGREHRLMPPWRRCQLFSPTERQQWGFLPRDAMHPPYTSHPCLSACLSQVGVLSKRLNESSWFFLACELPSTRPTLC